MPEHQPGCPTLVFEQGDPLAERLGLGAAALRYLKLGFAVVPLQRGGKKPHRMLPETGGVHHATTWPSQVWEWWKQDMAANVGIACGPSKLVVIDCDVKRGQQGPRVFAEHAMSRDDGTFNWEAVPYVTTPSGGVHLWLRAAGPVPERPGILPGVDIKAAGGLVVAPPSMSLHHPASQPGDAPSGVIPLPYYWTGCPCQIPAAPEWIYEWSHNAPTLGSPNELPDAPVGDIGELKRTGVQPGERNATFYRLACSLYRRHGTEYAGAQQVLADLGDVYAATDKAGFTWNELLTIADSARRFITESSERDEAIRQSWLARGQS